jgi:hypothetical protein
MFASYALRAIWQYRAEILLGGILTVAESALYVLLKQSANERGRIWLQRMILNSSLFEKSGLSIEEGLIPVFGHTG